MKKNFNFGKIAFYGNRKINSVEVLVELKDNEKGPIFSASGNIWNSKHTDIVCGGQCLDEIAKTSVGNNSTFKTIYKLWKLYHLNDMHAGTPNQEAALKEHFSADTYHDYTTDCEYLKSINLFEDHDYKYGYGWLYEAIPENDLNTIKSLLNS